MAQPQESRKPLHLSWSFHSEGIGIENDGIKKVRKQLVSLLAQTDQQRSLAGKPVRIAYFLEATNAKAEEADRLHRLQVEENLSPLQAYVVATASGEDVVGEVTADDARKNTKRYKIALGFITKGETSQIMREVSMLEEVDQLNLGKDASGNPVHRVLLEIEGATEQMQQDYFQKATEALRRNVLEPRGESILEASVLELSRGQWSQAFFSYVLAEILFYSHRIDRESAFGTRLDSVLTMEDVAGAVVRIGETHNYTLAGLLTTPARQVTQEIEAPLPSGASFPMNGNEELQAKLAQAQGDISRIDDISIWQSMVRDFVISSRYVTVLGTRGDKFTKLASIVEKTNEEVARLLDSMDAITAWQQFMDSRLQQGSSFTAAFEQFVAAHPQI